jgi:hypothetical protein
VPIFWKSGIFNLYLSYIVFYTFIRLYPYKASERCGAPIKYIRPPARPSVSLKQLDIADAIESSNQRAASTSSLTIFLFCKGLYFADVSTFQLILYKTPYLDFSSLHSD